jgi:hypothetical protein
MPHAVFMWAEKNSLNVLNRRSVSDQKANVGLIHHEDTKSTKFCLGSVPVPRFVFFVPSWLFPSPHEPADAIFEPRYVEVDQ